MPEHNEVAFSRIQRAAAYFSIDNYNRGVLLGHEGGNAIALSLAIAGAFMDQINGVEKNNFMANMYNFIYPPAFFIGSWLIGKMKPIEPKGQDEAKKAAAIQKQEGRKPYLLFYGCLSLATGGVFLTAAGYPLAGLVGLWASMESVRSAAGWILNSATSEANKSIESTSKKIIDFVKLAPASLIVATYGKAMEWALNQGLPKLEKPYNYAATFASERGILPLPVLGQGSASIVSKALHDRPMFYPQMAKMAMRSEILLISIESHNCAMAGVALSWAFGDFCLSMSDKGVRHWFRGLFGLPTDGEKLDTALKNQKKGAVIIS